MLNIKQSEIKAQTPGELAVHLHKHCATTTTEIQNNPSKFTISTHNTILSNDVAKQPTGTTPMPQLAVDLGEQY